MLRVQQAKQDRPHLLAGRHTVRLHSRTRCDGPRVYYCSSGVQTRTCQPTRAVNLTHPKKGLPRAISFFLLSSPSLHRH
ncbi:hypothetical protein V2G26_009843 [Clonostachys chloroleuca]